MGLLGRFFVGCLLWYANPTVDSFVVAVAFMLFDDYMSLTNIKVISIKGTWKWSPRMHWEVCVSYCVFSFVGMEYGHLFVPGLQRWVAMKQPIAVSQLIIDNLGSRLQQGYTVVR